MKQLEILINKFPEYQTKKYFIRTYTTADELIFKPLYNIKNKSIRCFWIS